MLYTKGRPDDALAVLRARGPGRAGAGEAEAAEEAEAAVVLRLQCGLLAEAFVAARRFAIPAVEA